MRWVETQHDVLLIPQCWDVFIYRGFLYTVVDNIVRCVEKLPTTVVRPRDDR